MVQLTNKHWAFECDEGYTLVHYRTPGQKELWIYRPDKERVTIQGTWQFLFTTKEATEEQMIELAGIPAQDVVHGWNREIFNARLASKGLDTNKNYAIIQKI